MKKKYLLLLLVFWGINLILSKLAFAAFSLSVRPYEGGYDLQFGKVGYITTGVNREVIVEINSDIGKQYRLIQTLFEPLTNAQGISFPMQSNFVVYALRGSNRSGTLSVEQETPVSFGRTIIYTSNQQGTADNFTLVYTLKGPFDVPAGEYRGRIGFTLEAIDTTQEPVTVFLNIFAEIETQSTIEIKTPSGSKFISLSSKRDETKSADVLFDIKGGLGKQFQILQSLTGSLRSEEGEELPYETVNFLLRDVKKGSGPTQVTPLASGEELLYTSGPFGEAESFIATYSLGDLSKIKAGRYRTNLKYFLRDFSYGSEIKNLDTYVLEVEIEKIFDLVLKTESGGGVILFRDLQPNGSPRSFEIEVQIQSNIFKQYQVTQKIVSDLVNKEGQAIPSKYFTVRTEKTEESKGILKLEEKTEVKKGETSLFISDQEGSSDSFKVIYELTTSSDIKAGDYSTSVIYSLSEL